MIAEPLERWEGATAGELAARWEIPAVHLYRRVGSTSDVARRLAAGGTRTGTLVLAEEQVAGRGRAGRGWHSPAGLGLWFSMVARALHPWDAATLPLVVGLTVAAGLDSALGPGATRLKWPNDLLVGGHKLGGILCESAWEAASPEYVVVGVGLNVLHEPEDFPEEIRAGATSVQIAAGGPVSRLDLATEVVRRLGATLRGRLNLSSERRAELEARDVLRGHAVTVTEPGSGAPVASGTALGIAPDGSLILRLPGGEVRPIRSGTVRLAGE